jgi:hypothetical protein
MMDEISKLRDELIIVNEKLCRIIDDYTPVKKKKMGLKDFENWYSLIDEQNRICYEIIKHAMHKNINMDYGQKI